MVAPRESAAHVALITAAVVWGGSVVAQKIALGAFSAVEVSVFRGLGALVILIPLWWWARAIQNKMGAPRSWRAHRSGGGCGWQSPVDSLRGLQYLDAGAAGVIIGASPAITAVLSALILKDVPFSRVWVGCAVSFIGVALVSGVNASDASGENPLLGVILVVLALVSWALYTIGSRRVMERMAPLTVNWTTLFISILIQIPLLWTDHKVFDAGMASVPSSGWMALVYVIVFATALGQQAWLYGVSGIGPSRAGVFTNFIPVSSLLLSVAILGESFDLVKVLGIALVLSGVWLVTRSSSS